MKPRIARQFLHVTLVVLALGASLQAQVHAQGTTGYIVIFPSVGVAPGESLRLTLFKPEGEPVRARAQIHHTGGILVALGDGSVRAGGFQSFDFKRSDIPLPGEAVTGRLQLRASFHITMVEPLIQKLAVSMETISITEGTSNTILVGEVLPAARGNGGGDDILIGGHTTHDTLTGIVRGQTLRATLFNPPSFDSKAESGAGAARHSAAIGGHVKVFDGSGNIIAQSDDFVIPPGEFRSFDFNHDALGVPGEPLTSRRQVRIKPFFDFRSVRLSRVLASFEIIENSTGKTQVLSGDECLVFFLGGTQGR